MGDGSVRFFGQHTSPAVLKALATSRPEEPSDPDWIVP
jgi:hypothetical protein